MSTTKELIGKISDYCGRPAPDKFLSFAVTKLFGRVSFYLNLLSNASTQNWIVAKLILNANPNQEEYNITTQAGDFGRAILVETYDQSDPNHIVREIEIVQLQDRDKNYRGRKNAFVGTSTYTRHTAACFTFYGTSETTALITPVPMNTAQYLIWYEPVRSEQTAIDERVKMIPNFEDLLAVHTAMLALDDCVWPDLIMEDKAAMEQAHILRRRERKATLEPEFGRLLAVFNDYRFNNKYEQADQRKPFNAYRRSGGGNRTRWGW